VRSIISLISFAISGDRIYDPRGHLPLSIEIEWWHSFRKTLITHFRWSAEPSIGNLYVHISLSKKAKFVYVYGVGTTPVTMWVPTNPNLICRLQITPVTGSRPNSWAGLHRFTSAGNHCKPIVPKVFLIERNESQQDRKLSDKPRLDWQNFGT